ncbi:MAG: Stk1 family PASTA domain-containing Ser/Thr kinase [Firmicutes bacterium]|nr:Stk1 family PASTA domain-containing Ser/Thr kinase [Bacillota bacterium]
MGSRILAGRYELQDKIGEGGMAVVFKARDRLLSRFVAIKILRPEYTKDAMFIESFRRESQIAAGLVHPNIVNVYDVGKEGNIYYIVMELIEGRPLSDIIKEEGPLDPYRAADIAKQVASALSMAHKHQLIHRDVKPHNIMITQDGTAKITDFGIAKAVTGGTLVGEQQEAVMGSVHYFSPEQARGAYVDEKSDIYSLGIVLYEMLTGKVPFDGDTAVAVAVKHMNEEMTPPSALNPDIPQDLEEIVMKATNKLQTGRYRSADEMITALNFVKFSKTARNSGGLTPALAKGVKGSEEVTTGGRKKGDDAESEENEEGGGRRFNWAYVVLILAALMLAIPASAFVRSMMSGSDPDEIRPGDIVQAPEIVGHTLDEAEEILKEFGLDVKVGMELPSNDVAEGVILSQTPDAGASIKSGQSIEVNVSKGKVDGSVPDVVGKSLANARTMLETYKFKVGVVSEEVSETVPKGTVISQSPVAGTTYPDGSEITLVVSLGSEKDVARSKFNVEGKSLDEAKKQIEELDLKLGEISYVEDINRKEDTVITQSPAPGMAIAEGDTIDLVVSKEPEAPEPVIEPEPETPPAPVTNAVAVWIDYSPAVNEDFTMTVTVSDSVNSPRTPLSQAARHKSDNGESFSAEGSGPDGKVLVFFDNALVYEYDVNFDTGEIH